MRADKYSVPAWSENWKARVVGLTYVLVGIKLYQNVYARMAPALSAGLGLGALSRRAIAAELWMRLMPMVNASLVLSTTLVQARFWPLATAIGQTATLMGNWVCVLFASQALVLAHETGLGTVPSSTSKVTGYDAFVEWSKSSAFYAAVTWAIGLLIYCGRLEDEWLYALAVAAINIGLFYLLKCGLGGPRIRVALHRSVFAAERLKLVSQSRLVDQPEKTAMAVPGPATS